MINYKKIILLKGVHVLLWMHLIVFVGLNVYNHYNFITEQIELSEKSEKSEKFPSETNGNCIGEEESENKQLSISLHFPTGTNLCEFKLKNSKKAICSYIFQNSSNPKDILTPPPQV